MVTQSKENPVLLLFKKKIRIYLFAFIFGCAGSLVPHGLSPVVVSRSYSSLRCTGFSLPGAQALGLQASGVEARGLSSCAMQA